MRLFIRVETSRGPRTIFSQELLSEDASAIAEALSSSGHEVILNGEVVAVASVKQLLQRRKVMGNLRMLRGGKP